MNGGEKLGQSTDLLTRTTPLLKGRRLTGTPAGAAVGRPLSFWG